MSQEVQSLLAKGLSNRFLLYLIVSLQVRVGSSTSIIVRIGFVLDLFAFEIRISQRRIDFCSTAINRIVTARGWTARRISAIGSGSRCRWFWDHCHNFTLVSVISRTFSGVEAMMAQHGFLSALWISYCSFVEGLRELNIRSLNQIRANCIGFLRCKRYRRRRLQRG